MAVEGLGRQYDTIPIASGVGINMDNCSGITFVCTGNDTFTLSAATTFAGSYTNTNWSPISHYYTNTATNGTAHWVRATQTAGSAVTISSGTAVIELLGTQMPGLQEPGGTGDQYVKCTASSAGLVHAILHDLNVQRKPANLQIPSA